MVKYAHTSLAADATEDGRVGRDSATPSRQLFRWHRTEVGKGTAETVSSAVAYRLSAALGAVALAASSMSFFIPGVLNGPAVAQGNLRGTALVVMVVAVPVLFTSMSLSGRGSARALVVWLGAVAYIVYQAVLFLFATPFNSLFLVYVAMLSLGFWTAVALLRQIDLAAFSARFDGRLPARGIAVYTLVLAALNAVVWLRTIVPAVLSDTPAAFMEGSGATTNPVFVQDLAVWLPLIVMAAWWLWRGRALGQLVVGAMPLFFYLRHLDTRVGSGRRV